ncbi:MAG TPA: threonine synthase, partial [Actinomycetota bacterium]|nr:threonine synthase [Actinomycetota bacterium]
MNRVSHLSCSVCEARYERGALHTVCTSCGSPLLVEYDLPEGTAPGSLLGDESGMWRYRELLPVPTDAS